MIHFILFIAFSLMFLIILRPYFTPREPSSGPPREENSKNDRAEVGEWIRIRNRYITSKGRCHMQAGGGSGPTSLSLHETMLLDVQDTKIPDTPMDATSNIHKQLGIS
ncbi:uncharacterized protein C5orf60-like isoform X2 [Papio anubis]|uniref:uncharacterized protein C5orf60-like isoform X2 n=1 Tax=Papio anubis TaxID=9555 RepID=UPI0012AE1B93|nr:uncharacterized protein C5orf60-like isoform X2 [Papio anubis]